MREVGNTVTEYATVKERTEGRFSIEKSVFLYICAPVAGAQDAENTLNSIRKEYPDATHHCYAYIADTLGNEMRFSDDGEPQGTAGMPMLEILKANNLRRILICAVRWFGGKKLGAGGLTRAYARAAKEAAASAAIITRKLCAVFSLSLSYEFSDKISRYLKDCGAAVIKTDYGAEINTEFAVPLEKEKIIVEGLKELSGGFLSPVKLKEEFI